MFHGNFVLKAYLVSVFRHCQGILHCFVVSRPAMKILSTNIPSCGVKHFKLHRGSILINMKSHGNNQQIIGKSTIN